MNRIDRRCALMVTVIFLVSLAFALPAAAGEDGAVIYKAKCAACHGASGSGDTPMGKKLGVKDLGAPGAQKLTNDELFDIISQGKNKMPSFEKRLSPEKIRLVVTHVRSLARS